jgi:hypothetical protein
MAKIPAADSETLDVIAELRRREPIFHRPEFGTTRADFERMMEPEFWEIGASGKRYNRELVLDELEKRYAGGYADNWETREFECREIATDNYLLTYTLVQGNRVTRRSTIWRRTAAGWKVVYHQGTIVQETR